MGGREGKRGAKAQGQEREKSILEKLRLQNSMVFYVALFVRGEKKKQLYM